MQARLHIALETGSDWTGPRPVPHPLVCISGDRAGLKRLRSLIDGVLTMGRATPDAHTHITGRDDGVTVDPTNLMVTIELLPDPPRGPKLAP